MDKYYEDKKRKGLIFTQHNIDPTKSYTAIAEGKGKSIEGTALVEQPGPIGWWDRKKGRYRTAEEQAAYVKEVKETNERVSRRIERENARR